MSTRQELKEGFPPDSGPWFLEMIYWKRVRTIQIRFMEVFRTRFNEALANNDLVKARNLVNGASYAEEKKD